MKPEKQRIAIAEACGWKFKKSLNADTKAWFDGEGNRRTEWHYPENRFLDWGLPDYLNDLNAMHEAEKTLKTGASILEDTEARNYRVYLRSIAGFSGAYTATAAQRAEAFLRTIGKWQD